MGRLVQAVVFASVAAATAGFAVACNLRLGNFSFGGNDACPALGSVPKNATVTSDGNGCQTWACNEGFHACGQSGACDVDFFDDPSNCGACGNACAGACSNGSCAKVTVLADGLTDAGAVAVSTAGVFFVSNDAIETVPASGGAPSVVCNNADAMALVVDGTTVYWYAGYSIDVTTPPYGTWFVRDDDVGGGSFAPSPILSDDAAFYGMTQGPPEVWRAPKDGGSGAQLYPLSQDWTYMIDSPIAIVGGKLAFADGENIVVGATDGSSRSVVATQPSGVATLAGDATSIYWIPAASWGPLAPVCAIGDAAYCSNLDYFEAGVPDGIFAVPWTGGAVRRIATEGRLWSMRARNGSLWGIGGAGDVLVRVDIATGKRTVFSGGAPIGGFDFDGARVYWTQGSKLLSAGAN